MKPAITPCGLMIAGVLFATSSLASASVTTYRYPGSTSTSVLGYSDTLIAGYYTLPDDNNGYAFLLQHGSFSTYSVPGAAYTDLRAVTGNTFVGGYSDASGRHAFVANTSGGYYPLNVPGYTNSFANGVSGNTVSLFAWNEIGAWHSFLYTNGAYSEFSLPGGGIYSVTGISPEGAFYGYYDNLAKGFVYSNGTLRTITIPNATQVVVAGVSGDIIVGSFSSDGNPRQSFLMRGDTTTLFSIPGARYTDINGIIGNTLFGTFDYDGFTTTLAIPEPASLFLLGVAPLFLCRARTRPSRYHVF